MNSNKYIGLSFGALALLVAGTASATDLNLSTDLKARVDVNAKQRMDDMQKKLMSMGVIGTITAVNGTSLTIHSPLTNMNYTVDTSAAVVKRANGATSTTYTVGESIAVQGAVNGSSVTAKTVVVGRFDRDFIDREMESHRMGITGSVTAVSGTTLTVKAKNGTVYTVNAANVKVFNGPKQAKLSDIVVGDVIAVQGKLDGNMVIAANILNMKDIEKSNPKPHKYDDRVVGMVTATSTNSITIEGRGDKVYTVDTTNAVIKEKNGATSTLSNITVGEKVTIAGTASGTAISADVVFEGNAVIDNRGNARYGMFEKIGSFFRTMFGKKR